MEDYFASVYGRPGKRNTWFIYFSSEQYKIKVLGNLSEGELRGQSPACIRVGLLGHTEGACAVSPASPLSDANLEPKHTAVLGRACVLCVPGCFGSTGCVSQLVFTVRTRLTLPVRF